jgi:hypothetical protein
MMLTGMSATGKSSLFTSLDNPSAKVSFSTPVLRSARGLHTYNLLPSIITDEDDVYFIDTDYVKLDNAFCRAIIRSASYFVLCGRAAVGGIAIHYKAVLKFPARVVRNHEAFAVYAGIKNEIQPSLTTIVEDSGAGLQFFRLYYAHLGSKVDVTGAGGYSRIAKLVNVLRSGTSSEIQIIADAATFGNVIEDFAGFAGLHFFLPECVEEIFLKCPMFDQGYAQAFSHLKYPSAERFYVRELRRQLVPTHQAYVKGHMHRCLTHSCVVCERGKDGLCSLRNDYKRPESIWEALEGKAHFSRVNLSERSSSGIHAPTALARVPAATQSHPPKQHSIGKQILPQTQTAPNKLSASQRNFLLRRAVDVTVTQYAKAHKLSSDAARRELNALVLRGLAVCNTQKRPYKYTAVHRPIKSSTR